MKLFTQQKKKKKIERENLTTTTKEEKFNIMVAHIKSHRLVAFLIYSSLSIYTSHGKKEYFIQISNERSIWLCFSN